MPPPGVRPGDRHMLPQAAFQNKKDSLSKHYETVRTGLRSIFAHDLAKVTKSEPLVGIQELAMPEQTVIRIREHKAV